jgi:hypothetical protein
MTQSGNSGGHHRTPPGAPKHLQGPQSNALDQIPHILPHLLGTDRQRLTTVHVHTPCLAPSIFDTQPGYQFDDYESDELGEDEDNENDEGNEGDGEEEGADAPQEEGGHVEHA